MYLVWPLMFSLRAVMTLNVPISIVIGRVPPHAIGTRPDDSITIPTRSPFIPPLQVGAQCLQDIAEPLRGAIQGFTLMGFFVVAGDVVPVTKGNYPVGGVGIPRLGVVAIKLDVADP